MAYARAAEEAYAIRRAKALYEDINGTATENRAKLAAAVRWDENACRQDGAKHADPFTAAMSAATGKSERTLQREAVR